MRADKFSEAMNGIGDKYIEEAGRYKRPKKAIKIAGSIAAACAAALIIIVGVGFALGTGNAGNKGLVPDTDYSGNESYEIKSPDGVMPVSPEVIPEKNEIRDRDPENEATDLPIDTGKIIYNVTVEMTVDDVQQTVSDIESAAKALGGYFESSEVTSSKNPYARITARIPAEKLDEFTAALNDTEDVTFFDKNAVDVSESYRDYETRLKTAEEKLSRLQELLKQANDISDIIEIENAIEDAEYEVDSYKSQLNSFDGKITYATVDILIHQGEIVVEPYEMTFGERIGLAFHNGIAAVGRVFQAIAIFFAATWLWWIIIGVIIAAAIAIPLTIVNKKK